MMSEEIKVVGVIMGKFNLGKFNELYFDKELSLRMVARELGLSDKAGLSYYIKKYKIPVRSKNEAIKLAFQKRRRNVKGENNPNYKDGKQVDAGVGKRWNKYGITEEEFNLRLIKQNNRCAICGGLFVETPRIDHNHDTGEVRGLLCNSCNGGIGLFKDDLALIKKAIDYLLKYDGNKARWNG